MMQTALHSCTACTLPVGSRRTPFLGSLRVQHSRSACSGSSGGRTTLQVCAKGKSRMRQGYGAGAQMPPSLPTPEPDPENVEFVLFVRNKTLPRWIPLSIMNSGGPANTLVRSLDSGWGRALFSNILIRNVAQSLYKDIKSLERSCRQNLPELKTAKELEFGFKIREKDNPKNWHVAKNITIIPPAKQMGGTPLDNIRAFFSGAGK